MKSLLSIALLATAVAACGRSVDMFPVGVGGGGVGNGSGGSVDGAGDGIAGSTINGRVCFLNSDARAPTSCATSGAEGLIVTIGGAVATAAADGSFSIMPTSDTDLVWRVNGAAIEASAMQLKYGATIPAISKTLFDTMALNNHAATDGVGSVIGRFTLAGHGISGINNVVTTPAAASQILYDGQSATTWDLNQTGSYGVVWVPGLAPGSAEISLNGAQNATISGIPVFADTVTFVLAEIQ